MEYNEYTKQFSFPSGIAVSFDQTSLIVFYDKETGEKILSLDPSELKTVYYTYIGTQREYEQDQQRKQERA